MASYTEGLDENVELEKREQDSPALRSPARKWTRILLRYGVEERGIVPVPVEEQTDTDYTKMISVFFSSNFTILAFSLGTVGPIVFQLSVRDSCLVIICFNLICAIGPAYLATWGAQLGMRQMTLARYAFGYYGVILPSFLNLLGIIGFSVLNCILGGQALASVTNGHLSWTVGIVIFTIVSVIVSFFGYKFLHWYERLAWIPIMICAAIAVGVGRKHLGNFPSPIPVSAGSILGYAGAQAGFTVAWASFVADYGVYLSPRGSSWKIFCCAFAGLYLPIVFMGSIGAAIAAASPFVQTWNEAFQGGGDVGGLINAVYEPLGNFGKFLTVIMSLSVSPNLVSILYSASLNYQVFIPRLGVVPRYFFTIFTGAIVLPIAIVGAHKLDAAITNFLALVGYWASSFMAILVVEHVYFRKADFSNYDREAWNKPKRLPCGIAAVGSGILAFGLVIPCMGQVIYTGPIAKTTGDLGFEVALALTAILYLPFRWLEIRLQGHL